MALFIAVVSKPRLVMPGALPMEPGLCPTPTMAYLTQYPSLKAPPG